MTAVSQFRLASPFFLFFFAAAITIVYTSQDHDVPSSVDGLRCNSCGTECSVMCGSRNFRACCYNYIKKRSIPWQSGGVDSEDENQGLKASSPVSDLKSTTGGLSNAAKAGPILIKHEAGNGKHLFRRYVPDIGDSLEDGELLYPLSLRDLMTSMIRSWNLIENKKTGRNGVF
ncbi:unnamed protein product [Orchesella dallaii]|uniref:Trissin n=1 Tax=Orchesella dallaii TaxID=48710 RepID=A0ABP1S247_9HEXA